MRRHRLYVRPGEQGYVLPIALAFLTICAVLTAFILTYVDTGQVVAARYEEQRSNLYRADSAIDAAIKYAQSNGSLGSVNDSTCTGNVGQFFTMIQADGSAVNVTCTAGAHSGGGGGVTTAPNFAILALSPYHGAAPGVGGSYPSCVNTHDELGVVQVQNSKLLQIYGNVYVNADVDADTYKTDGCPNVLGVGSALPMVVYGNVIQRESNHDFCAGPTNGGDPQCNPYTNAGGPTGLGTAPYTDTAPLSNAQLAAAPAATQSALADPGIPANDPGGMWQPNFTDPPAAGVIRDSGNNVITTCPAADPSSGFRLIKFSPGTYSNVGILNGFTNGGCQNAVLWFQPGDYYFNFTDAGAPSSTVHQWTVQDTGIRIIGGQPFGGPGTAPTSVSQTWKPTVASSAGFTTPNNAFAIDGTPTTANIANGATATLTLSKFRDTTNTPIPPDAQINSVRLRVAHGEGDTNLLKQPTVTITTPQGTNCTVLPINAHNGAPTEDPAPNYDVFSISGNNCLSDVSKIGDLTKVVYTAAHCAPVAGACTNVATTDSVDGIWLDITYSTGGRTSWNPIDPATITPSAPSVPGACLSDRDSGNGWNDGVQFVFGGDSHVQLKSGKIELCNKPSANKQEIVLYGVRQSTVPTTVGPVTWTSHSVTNGNPNGFTNPANAQTVDGTVAIASLTAAIPTGTISVGQFSGVGAIPANATITAVQLQVTHSEPNTTNTKNPTVAVSSGATTCPGATLAEHTTLNATGADNVDLTTCLSTPALLNAGVSALFTASRAANSPTENLDGMKLLVTYTTPGLSTGTLAGASGCVTQTPYYTPPLPGSPNQSHAPGYNGACALIQVATDAVGGSAPRLLALWGTVYAPSAAMDVPVDVMTVPVFNRGVVARMLMLGYNVANNAIVPITTTPNAGFVANNRTMMLKVAIPGKTTSVVANIKICDYEDADCPVWGPQPGSGPPVRVLSWKNVR